jgi:hypothetical protein
MTGAAVTFTTQPRHAYNREYQHRHPTRPAPPTRPVQLDLTRPGIPPVYRPADRNAGQRPAQPYQPPPALTIWIPGISTPGTPAITRPPDLGNITVTRPRPVPLSDAITPVRVARAVITVFLASLSVGIPCGCLAVASTLYPL